MHPLVEDLSILKNQEIENKIYNLTNKYFLTNNVYVREQILNLLNSYKEVLYNRQQEELEQAMNNRDKDLDKLINIS